MCKLRVIYLLHLCEVYIYLPINDTSVLQRHLICLTFLHKQTGYCDNFNFHIYLGAFSIL